MANIAQLYLMVRDIDISTAFYRDVIGLSLTSRSDTKSVFESGMCELVIEQEFDAETLDAFGLRSPGDHRGDGVILVVEVGDPDSVFGRAESFGSEIPSPPREVSWGREICLIEDPDGYIVEASRPIPESSS